MNILIVVNNLKYWPITIPNVEIVPARKYLTDPAYLERRGVKVFNLCRSYRYQTTGYYVSLLAEARGHRPTPSISTIQDMKSMSIVKMVSDELEDLIAKSLKRITTNRFTLSIYFGRNVAKQYDRLSAKLFSLFHAPFLQAEFRFDEEDGWWLSSIRPLSAIEIPENHIEFVHTVVKEYFDKQRFTPPRHVVPAFNLAILRTVNEESKASTMKAVEKFISAAKKLGLGAEIITKDDFGSLGEFDALFIRDTTAVNHYTYRFSRRAQAEGLVVIDDPNSILRCSNKVYLAELLELHGIARPKTIVVHKEDVKPILGSIGLPCILKQPDGSFSGGVFKATTKEQLNQYVAQLLEDSSLIIAQEYIPTPFDWRVGIFDRRPLFVCKYHMAADHWQIVKHEGSDVDYGMVEAVPLNTVPPKVITTALRAANLIGDGLYGVDIKQVGNRVMVIEVNDNPNIDAGYEDTLLKDELYIDIMRTFMKRIIATKKAGQKYGKEIGS